MKQNKKRIFNHYNCKRKRNSKSIKREIELKKHKEIELRRQKEHQLKMIQNKLEYESQLKQKQIESIKKRSLLKI